MKHPKSYNSTPEIRKRMSKVHLKNGKGEQIMSKRLYHLGFRYRKNYKELPGSPDIAVLKFKIAIFIDGEFWHGKDWVIRKEKLNRNKEYWIEKIEENMVRDNRVDQELREIGWIPVRFWEKDAIVNTDDCIDTILLLATYRQYIYSDIPEM